LPSTVACTRLAAVLDLPDVSYEREGSVAVVCEVVGDGPADVVYARQLTAFTLGDGDEPEPKGAQGSWRLSVVA
jgi:hypothetical protein